MSEKQLLDYYDHELEKIYQSFVKLLTPLRREEIYEKIVTAATSLVDAEYGTILLAKEGGSFRRAYTNTPEKFHRLKSRKKGNVYKAFTEQKITVLTKEEIEKTHPDFNNKNIQSIILIPLTVNNISIGVLSLQSTKKEHFDAKRKRILTLFGAMATLAIRNVNLLRERQEAVASRDLFISMASHELRSPLATISGYAQLIERNLKLGKNLQAKWSETLNSEIVRLTRIINEMLDIDYIRTGRFQYEMEAVSLATVLGRVMRDFSYTFPNKKLVLQNLIKGEDVVFADSDKLLQTFGNILNNANKFSYSDTPIEIEATKKDKYFYISITNQGDGISKKDIPFIFDNFYKGNPNAKGMGLGLYIAKNIVSEHGGEITITSKKKQKTTFTVQLPQK